MTVDAVPLKLARVEAKATANAAGWPEFDPSVLQQGRADPPPLPLEVFGPWADWLASAAEGASAPPDYAVAPLLAAVASLIGTTRRVSPWPSWAEPSVLWCGSVGDPSSGKSPGADPVLGALRHAERDMAEGFPDVLARWRADAERAKAVEDKWKGDVKTAVKEGMPAPPLPDDATVAPEPVPPRLVVADTTPEALAAVLAANPRGVMATRDELAGWLDSFTRYGPGSSRSMWIEAFGARSYRIDRVKNGAAPLMIPALAVSVFGTTQPEKLAEMLKDTDDGLASRFLWVWPRPVEPSEPSRPIDFDLPRRAFDRLRRLQWADAEHTPVTLPVQRAGVDALNSFRTDNARATRETGGLLASAMGKAPGLVLRLALVLEHLWWAAKSEAEPPAEVSGRAVLGAVALWEVYFRPMAARVYGDAALPPAERNAATLARRIRKEGADRVNLRAARRQWRLPGLSTAEAMSAAALVLVEAGALMPAAVTDDPRPGRPSSDFLVNPKLLEV